MEPKYNVGSWIKWQDGYQSCDVVSKILGYISCTPGEYMVAYQVMQSNNTNYPVYPEEVINVLTDEQAAIWLLET